MTSKTIQRSIFIEARLWFDRSGGNTYHSVRIWVDGEIVGKIGMTYGYGEQYLTTAYSWLHEHGFTAGLLNPDTDFKPEKTILREAGIDAYCSEAYVAKSGLFKWSTDEVAV